MNENFTKISAQEFIKSLDNYRETGLEPRTTYTLAELMRNVSNGICYEYNNSAKLNNEKFYFSDTITIVNANNSYSTAQATAVYDSVVSQAHKQALRVGSTNVYLHSVLPIPISSTSTTIDVEVLGVYVNNVALPSAGNDTIYMPDDRFFEYIGDCDDIYNDEVPGAAAYLTKWLVKKLLNYPVASNQYFANLLYVENAFDCTLDSWSPDSLAHFSQSFKWNLLMLNPNDSVLRDGHKDYKTFGYHYKKGDSGFMTSGGCVTPDDLSYYAPNAKAEIINQKSIHNREVVNSMFKVDGRYQIDCSAPTDSMMGSWDFKIIYADLLQDSSPTPKKDILY